MISQNTSKNIKGERDECVNDISSVEHWIMNALNSNPPLLTLENSSSPVLTAQEENTAVTDFFMLEAHKLLKDIKSNKTQQQYSKRDWSKKHDLDSWDDCDDFNKKQRN